MEIEAGAKAPAQKPSQKPAQSPGQRPAYLIGPHLGEKDTMWNLRCCQVFIQPPRFWLRKATWQHFCTKFPSRPRDRSYVGNVYVVHTSYVCRVQSPKPEVAEKSWYDLNYTVLIANMVFPPESTVFINMHYNSSAVNAPKKLKEARPRGRPPKKATDKATEEEPEDMKGGANAGEQSPTKVIAEGSGMKATPMRLDLLSHIMKKAHPNVKLVFENEPFDDFDTFIKETYDIAQKCPSVGICVDTAHLFGGGLHPEDLSSHLQQWKKPDLIHLNGNSCEFNSKKDIHENMTSQFDHVFTRDTLKAFLQKWGSVPMIIEQRTPEGYVEDEKLCMELLGQ